MAKNSLVSLLTISVTFDGIFSVFRSHVSSTTTAIAPFSMALLINSCPSTVNPFIATNKNPFSIFFELLLLILCQIVLIEPKTNYKQTV